jgi:thiamine-monophosphate kinase
MADERRRSEPQRRAPRAGSRGEREFTSWLAGFFTPPPGRGVLGIGDDAAVVVNRAPHTVAACDPVVEGVHFTPDAPLRLVGRKAVHRNLADLAAMGATFDYALVSVLWPAARPARDLTTLMRGVRDGVERHGGYVVGGDTASTKGPLTVTVTVLGHATHRVLPRDGARAGDAIHVSAPLGGSILGHHLRFVPPLALGAALARRTTVSAMMDISDGLTLDLATLLRASSHAAGMPLCAHLDGTRIPISAAARKLARQSGKAPIEHALGDGEDHALLFTMQRGAAAPPAVSPGARTPIGGVELAAKGHAGAVFISLPGLPRLRLREHGYEHELGSGAAGPARRHRR